MGAVPKVKTTAADSDGGSDKEMLAKIRKSTSEGWVPGSVQLNIDKGAAPPRKKGQ